MSYITIQGRAWTVEVGDFGSAMVKQIGSVGGNLDGEEMLVLTMDDLCVIQKLFHGAIESGEQFQVSFLHDCVASFKKYEGIMNCVLSNYKDQDAVGAFFTKGVLDALVTACEVYIKRENDRE